jgi:hypothetical protein
LHKPTSSLPLRLFLFATHTVLPCRVLKLSLLMRHIHPAAALLLIARVGKALSTLPNSHTLPLEVLSKDS